MPMTRKNDFCKRTGMTDKESHLEEEALASYVEALRAGTEKQLPPAVSCHVENCFLCQGKILDVFTYLHDPLAPPALSRLRMLFPAPRSTRPAWLHLVSRLAATFFVVALMASGYFLFLRNPPPHPDALLEKKPVPGQGRIDVHKGKPDDIHNHPIATTVNDGHKLSSPAAGRENFRKAIDPFAINHNLEFMIDSRSRSYSVEVHSPVNNATLKGEIFFSWREFSHEPLNLVILNNHNEPIFESPISNGQLQFIRHLDPGCYYWKLESAAELYYVGKFLIAAETTSPKE